MNLDDMAKGVSIEIIVRCNGKTMNFDSEIALVKDNYVLISGIKVNNQTVGFSDSCTINFLSKLDNKLFLWENVKVQLVKYDDSIYHKIILHGDGKPFNRREAYRMYLGEDMSIYVNSSTGPAALSVLVKDISETGVCFISKDELDVSRTFRLRLKDNDTIISLSGIIVRKQELKHIESNLYGCKFNEKNNMLMKFIAKKQGDQLKNKSKLYAKSKSRDYILK
jgi:hypothetical protein